MEGDEAPGTAVLSRFDAFGDAYERKDVAAIMTLFAPDGDIVFYGTGADEKRVGRDELRAQFERDFAQAESVSFRWNWRAASPMGTAAWIAADGIVDATVEGADYTFPLRMTCVLGRHGDDWVFVQMHLSVPASGEAEGQSFPMPY